MFIKLLSLILLHKSAVQASPGDQLDIFNDCKYACEHQRECQDSAIKYIDPKTNVFHVYPFQETPWPYENFLLWSCIDDCDYQCQQIITSIRIEHKEEIYQFHGKWPFIRSWGLQEFYSVIFSIGNFIPHYWGFRKLNKMIRQSLYPGSLKRILMNYIFFAFCGMCAWIASSVFHCRDVLFTEKCDYFFAGLTVLSAFHGLFIRITRLYHHPRISKYFTCCMVCIFIVHLVRLYVDWSYTYNMRFNIFFGILQYGLLILLSYQNFLQIKRNNKNNICNKFKKDIVKLCILPLALVLVTSIAMSFELFDFFNYQWQVDSHALWHGASILPTFFLYEFLIDDYKNIFESGKYKV